MWATTIPRNVGHLGEPRCQRTTREDGAPLHYSVVLAEFQALLASLRLPRKRFYNLRHQCASFLIAEGAELRDVMEQLGHSQISLTADT